MVLSLKHWLMRIGTLDYSFYPDHQEPAESAATLGSAFAAYGLTGY